MTQNEFVAVDPYAPLRSAVAQVLTVDDVTEGRDVPWVLRFRGQLLIDSEQAYEQVNQAFQAQGYTPLFRLEEGRHVILVMRGVINAEPSNPWVNVGLFALTVLSVFYTGALYGYQGPETDPVQILLIAMFEIWRGWQFGLAMLAILLAHEFGHYLAARYHRAPATLPYFIPLPYLSPFGTMGAVIVMKAPVRNRRILADIGMAGPLAGFIVAIPILILGLQQSQVLPLPLGGTFSLEGNSLIYLALKYLIKGALLPEPQTYLFNNQLLHWVVYFFTSNPLPVGGRDVLLGPLAWAGWAGLLVTGINLIPVGQLDGGHALFVLLGNRVQKLLPFILGTLIVLGFVWQGWWLWALLVYFLNRRPAELLDEITPLDPRRRALAIFTLILFFVVVTPVPLTVTGG